MAIPGAPDPNKQFQVQRDAVSQRAASSQQQGTDALRRRFAAMGGLNSGAAIKAQQNVDDAANMQKEQGMAQVDALEAQRADKLADRDYASAEAQKGRDFQSGESQKGRDFQLGESDKSRAFQDKVFAFDSSSKLRQLDLADKQFALDKENTEFNKRKARWEAGNQGGLFGGGGFLGTGIGAGPSNDF